MSALNLHHAGRASPPKAKCTTTKADCCPTAKICATAWMWTAWAASTPAPSAARASVESSAAATGSGFTSRWRWRVERSSGINLPPNDQGLDSLFCFVFTLSHDVTMFGCNSPPLQFKCESACYFMSVCDALN